MTALTIMGVDGQTLQTLNDHAVIAAALGELGVQFERWLHRHGCGQWFNVARDTVTHEIKAVYKMTDPKPDVSGGGR